jgi:16S rRNA (adenine1518-N6/adenine1519-N6)-dimethyltransferase
MGTEVATLILLKRKKHVVMSGMSTLRDEVLGFLQLNGIRLNTDLGQHFLIDEFVLETILETAKIQPTDSVWEVGPGVGVLTRELVKRARSVSAVEIDQRFIALLKRFVGQNNVLNVIHGNALHIQIPSDTPYKVVANIPYHITSPLLHHFLLESALRPTSMTLLIQKEVAENICSEGSDSILTVLVALFGKATLECEVPPACFVPPPKVDSAVIHIECYEKPIVDTERAKKILSLAKHGMSQRRKMLSNTIGQLPNGMEALKEAGIDATRRPQTVKIDEWMTLEEILRKSRP